MLKGNKSIYLDGVQEWREQWPVEKLQESEKGMTKAMESVLMTQEMLMSYH